MKFEDYRPHPIQRILHESPADMILFGGSAGGGKTTALVMEAISWALRVPDLNVWLFAKEYPTARDVLFERVLAAVDDSWKTSPGNLNFEAPNGSKIWLGYMMDDDDPRLYYGRYGATVMDVLLVDNSSGFPVWFLTQILRRNRHRGLPDVGQQKLPRAVFASGPGGVSDDWHRENFFNVAEPFEKTTDSGGVVLNEFGHLSLCPRPSVRQFIPTGPCDNPSLARHAL
jgi:hypothetical protein